MLTLIAAALVAAQPTPAADAHAQHAGMSPMQHEQHEGMMDCCKKCCEEMKGHEDPKSTEAQPKRGQ